MQTQQPINFQRDWKDVRGYEGLYQVSNDGLVKSLKARNKWNANRLLIPHSHHQGYLGIRLSRDGEVKEFRIHRLVMIAFIGEPPFENAEVNHKNGDKADNRIENLEWCTAKQNTQHAGEVLGVRATYPGEANGHSRLTAADVTRIRQLWMSGSTQVEIAGLYQTTQSHIGRIVRREAWKNVP